MDRREDTNVQKSENEPSSMSADMGSDGGEEEESGADVDVDVGPSSLSSSPLGVVVLSGSRSVSVSASPSVSTSESDTCDCCDRKRVAGPVVRVFDVVLLLCEDVGGGMMSCVADSRGVDMLNQYD